MKLCTEFSVSTLSWAKCDDSDGFRVGVWLQNVHFDCIYLVKYLTNVIVCDVTEHSSPNWFVTLKIFDYNSLFFVYLMPGSSVLHSFDHHGGVR